MAAVSGRVSRPPSSPPRDGQGARVGRVRRRCLLAALLIGLGLPAGVALGAGSAGASALPAVAAAGVPGAVVPAGEGAPPLDLVALTDSALVAGWADTIHVDADRTPGTPYPGGPSTVTVVALEDRTGGADLAELLARSAGVQIRRYGGLGAEAVPSIRGSTGAQVAVLIDGVPLADARDGAIDLAALPLERFAAAEIHRGLVPARFGGGSAVGAINLLTRGGGASEARLFAGSYGDLGGRWLRHWRGPGGGSAFLLAHGRRIDNRYAYLDHRQTFANQRDDGPEVRRNAQFAEWGLWGGGRTELGGVRLDASLGTFRRDGGRPGPLGYLSPHAAVRRQRRDGRLSAAVGGDALTLDVTAAREIEVLHDEYGAGEVGWDAPGTTRGTSDDLGARLTWAARLRPGPALGLGGTLGVDWRRQWYDERRRAVDGTRSSDPLRRRDAVTGFGSLRLDWFPGRLAALPAVRWRQLVDDFPPLDPLGRPLAGEARHVEAAWSPSLALLWEAVPARLLVEGHVARTVRPPTWTELFGHRGGILGRLDLRPEQLRTWDLACRWRRGDLQLRLGLFESRAERAIVFRQVGQRLSQPVNIGATLTRGVEWEAAGPLPGDGAWRLDLTVQEARDRGEEAAYRGRRLPFLPAVEGSLHLERGWGGWRLGATGTFLGANYRDRYNSDLERAPARTLLDLSLGRSWRSAWPGLSSLAVTAELINVADSRVYDVEGFPLPGRSARVSLQLR